MLFNSLTSDQKEVFLEVMRQVAIDTTANILGVLDGVNSIEGLDCELQLTCDDETDPLNGDLQDLFLAEEEATGLDRYSALEILRSKRLSSS
ncbi:hypothetical protein [Ciceribacter azotifigens]|uniref:hypothetical protein n=1 Tax=Ciceribacter azotifigens TaxID=2069303 RepID=UPI003A8A82A9